MLADPYLHINKELYPEYKDLTSADALRNQLFLIGMTLKGNSWIDLLRLPDTERIWLYNKCSEHWDKQKEEMDKASRKR